MSTDRCAPPPQGDYAPAVLHAGIVYTAGMTPRRNGVLDVVGTVGADVDVDTAYRAAGLAARNAVAAVRSVQPDGTGDIRCLQMTVYVSCTADFTSLTAVADGATAALTEVLGPVNRPARSAIGVASLPSGAPVEVQLIAAVG